MSPPPVDTLSGPVVGVDLGAVTVFRGIPYAAPPVGSLRWQPPAPVPPWTEPLAAASFGSAAPQPGGPPTPLPDLDVGPTDESCLTLNIWAPHGATARPVMVWIHGGAFISGSTAVPSYDCATIAAEHGLVVVSVNYRIGALGFAPVGGVCNIGLLDQLAALGWVAENIAAVGGDPTAITVWGESAGGGSITHLLAAPSATGRFRRAIVQSGATSLTLDRAGADLVAERFVAALAPLDPATAAVEAVLRAQVAVASELTPVLGTMPFHPTVDGDLIGARPVDAVAAGSAAGVDLLVGTTANELNLYADPRDDLGAQRLARRAAKYLALFGVTDPATVLAAYDGSPGEVWAALRTDAEMWLPALALADAHVAAGGRAFTYRFDWPAAPPNAQLGACHAIDLPFTFGTFAVEGWDRFVGVDDDAVRLGAAVREAWAAFATTGDPTTEALGAWPDHASGATMLLGRESRVAHDLRREARAAWAKATD